MTAPVNVWLDCDPGHDDAIAILLVVQLGEINLLGISTVHGNGSLLHTTLNAARCLLSFASPAEAARIPIISGVSQPLIRPVKHDTEIHGDDGLGGVEGLPASSSPSVQSKLAEGRGKNVVVEIANAARSLPEGEKMAIVATGTLTNVALFISVFPELLERVSEIVLMGGAEGRGNRSPTGEFNIICDPEAADIVFNCPIKVVMVPLNITHTNLFSPKDNAALLKVDPERKSLHSTGASTQLRHTLSTLLNFFAATYAKVFGFVDGPPVHDPLCIAYLSHPHLFKGKRYRVDVELHGKETAGTTVVDLWEYKKAQVDQDEANWGREGKNVYVLEEVDVAAFWGLFQACVDSADLVSPLNKK